MPESCDRAWLAVTWSVFIRRILERENPATQQSKTHEKNPRLLEWAEIPGA